MGRAVGVTTLALAPELPSRVYSQVHFQLSAIHTCTTIVYGHNIRVSYRNSRPGSFERLGDTYIHT